MATNDVASSSRDEPEGIGGWLILPLILLIVIIVAGVLQLSNVPALAKVTDGLAQWKIYVLSAQLLFSVILGVACPIALLVMLMRKTRRFPRLFVMWAGAYVAFAIANHFLVLVLFNDVFGFSWASRFSLGALRPLLMAIVPVAIFIPYMLKSRRVRNTFVR